MMFAEDVLLWHDGHARDLPWRGEKDPYKIWVSEIMLQQTTTATVKGYYERFLTAFPTVRALAEAPEEDVLKMWEGLGYYTRAGNLMKAARIVAFEMDGNMPKTAATLKKLPGIGDYTAGAIASMAFGEKALAMDGNLIRVLSRVTAENGSVGENAVKKRLYETGMALIDEKRPGDFNQALMGLGNMVCVPGRPHCEDCPVAAYCEAHRLGRESDFPVMPPKIEKKIEHRGVALVFRGDTVLVRQRPRKGLLAGLWEFPHFENALDEASLTECLQELGIKTAHGRKTGAAVHTFTHIVWKMQGFRFETDSELAEDNLRFVSLQKLSDLTLPSAMRAFREQTEGILNDRIGRG